MDARNSTAANADLWTAYLREQWRAWFDPFELGRPPDEAARIIAEATAAGIATALSALMAPSIRRMYAGNAPAVTRAVARQDVAGETPVEDTVIPPDYARRTADESQRESWRLSFNPREEAVLAY